MVGSGVDSTFAAPPFQGLDAKDADSWITRFEKYSAYRGFSDHERLHLTAVLLRDRLLIGTIVWRTTLKGAGQLFKRLSNSVSRTRN